MEHQTRFTRPLAIVLGGAATLAVAALWWGAFPALRNVDRFPVFAEKSATGSA